MPRDTDIPECIRPHISVHYLSRDRIIVLNYSFSETRGLLSNVCLRHSTNMSTLDNLFDSEIPVWRQALRDNNTNLERVADYCEQNYLESKDKEAALKVTKTYATKSLTSVARQINALATNMIQMLDLQATQVSQLESDGNYLAQVVDIHKEKLAREVISAMATDSGIVMCTEPDGAIPPYELEKPLEHVRQPINFSRLDNIGHALKISCDTNSSTVTVNLKDNATPHAPTNPSHPNLEPPSLPNRHVDSYDSNIPFPPPPSPTDLTALLTGDDEYRDEMHYSDFDMPLPKPPFPLPEQAISIFATTDVKNMSPSKQPMMNINSSQPSRTQGQSDPGPEGSYITSMIDSNKQRELVYSQQAVISVNAIESGDIVGNDIEEGSLYKHIPNLPTAMPGLISTRHGTTPFLEPELPLPPSLAQLDSFQSEFSHDTVSPSSPHTCEGENDFSPQLPPEYSGKGRAV